MAEPGYFWDDYAAIAFTADEQSYYVGTNALAADPDLLTTYPVLTKNPENNQPGFTAHRTVLYPSQDCLVRFNGSSRIQHLLLANNFYTFTNRIHTIYVVRSTVNGVLYCHFEG